MSSQGTCCGQLFSGFTYQDLCRASPPRRKGVYVIRVKQKGEPAASIVRDVDRVVQRLQWPIVHRKMLNRVKRVQGIGSCPTIYIGSAGTRQSSEHTLSGRYRDFAGRHTAMYPLWALVYFGWQLEYGWIENENPAVLEESLKRQYTRSHDGRLPALVYR